MIKNSLIYAGTLALMLLVVDALNLGINAYGHEDFNNNRAGIFENTTNNIRDLFIFNDVCVQYIELQVIEEADKCLIIYREFNDHMSQLWQKYNDTLSKNIAIGNETGPWPQEGRP
jgi:hypothetical protein